MLRLDSFDDAVGQIEGWRIFANLMRELIRDDDLKRKMEGEDSEITKVLEEKLIRGKPKDIRTSLLSLEILRSLGEHPHEGDFWSKSLVGKSLAHLESGKWKIQKAGITILSTLAQTKYGVDAIVPHIESIINMLLPDSLEPQEKTAGGSPLKPSRMLGPACALRVLSEDETLRKTTHETAQLESLKDLWLDGNLIKDDTLHWRVKTPTRDDVLKMIDKMIKSVSGDFSEDLGTTSAGRSTLPEIHHWARLAVLVRDSVVKVVAPPAKVTAKVVRYTSQRLSARQMTYFLGRLQQRRSQHAG